VDLQEWRVGEKKLKRFTFSIFNQLSKLNPNVLVLHDIGFLRFEEGSVKAIYLVCYYAHEGNPGFVKFVKINPTEFVIDSYYHTISKILEVRYSKEYNIIAEYVNYVEYDKQVYLKLVDGVKKSQYVIDKKAKKEFPEFRKEIAEYIETDTNEFNYFVKDDNDSVYLQVK